MGTFEQQPLELNNEQNNGLDVQPSMDEESLAFIAKLEATNAKLENLATELKKSIKTFLIMFATATQVQIAAQQEGLKRFDLENKDEIESLAEIQSKLQMVRDAYGDDIDYWLPSFDYYMDLASLQGRRYRYSKRWILGEQPTNNSGGKGEVGQGFESLSPLPLDSISSMEMRGFVPRYAGQELITFDEIKIEMSNEEVMSDVLSKMPDRWLSNVSSVRQVDEDMKGSDAYGLDRDKWTTLASAQLLENGKTKIVLYSPTMESHKFSNEQTIIHEIAHANDWVRSKNLSVLERANMLLEVTDRLESDDRYLSTYVESINNEDKSLEKYLKAAEYWAEISSIYFTQPSTLNVADFELVGRYVTSSSQNDPKN